jgi:small subunit ribosomal protein S21
MRRPYCRSRDWRLNRNAIYPNKHRRKSSQIHQGHRCSDPAAGRNNTIGKRLQVFVRDNNVDQALRILKKKMQREGVFREMKRRKAYEKPSERKTREKAEAIRRARKAARKQAQRDGLIPAPKPREVTRGGVGRGRVGGMQSQGRA